MIEDDLRSEGRAYLQSLIMSTEDLIPRSIMGDFPYANMRYGISKKTFNQAKEIYQRGRNKALWGYLSAVCSAYYCNGRDESMIEGQRVAGKILADCAK